MNANRLIWRHWCLGRDASFEEKCSVFLIPNLSRDTGAPNTPVTEPRTRRAWEWADVGPALSKSIVLLLLVAIRVTKDVGIAGILLLGLFSVHTIRDRLSVPGWAASWVVEVHEWATIISYAIFAALLVWDIIDLHKGPPR